MPVLEMSAPRRSDDVALAAVSAMRSGSIGALRRSAADLVAATG